MKGIIRSFTDVVVTTAQNIIDSWCQYSDMLAALEEVERSLTLVIGVSGMHHVL